MSGRCCLGQDDGNGIWRAANSGVAVTGITQRFSPAPFLCPGPARPKASDSLIKGRAERPDRRHLDLDRRRARPEADRHGIRASGRPTAIAERDDHGVGARAGSDARSIADRSGFCRAVRIDPRMGGQMVTCSAQAVWPQEALVAPQAGVCSLVPSAVTAARAGSRRIGWPGSGPGCWRFPRRAISRC